MAVKNAFYAQSGGPTAVINASACAVIETARAHPDKIGKVFAGRNGIVGALTEDLIDTSLESPADIARLRTTPGAAFGSCRYKLKSIEEHRAQYERLIEVCRAHDIGYFFYNGGNDSMDTAWKVSQLSEKMGHPLICVGVPKTVDNDLPLTDCCPGFGSVAKYVATSIREAGLDVASMARTSTKIFVLEVMGRHAGWITAACGLASGAGVETGQPPHILLFPEVPFDEAAFLARVQQCVDRYDYCTIAVSEGLKTADGKFVSEQGGKDAFGHSQLGGAGQWIAQLIKDKLGHKYHWALADYLQRAARPHRLQDRCRPGLCSGQGGGGAGRGRPQCGDAHRAAPRRRALPLGSGRGRTEGRGQCGTQDAGGFHQHRRFPHHRQVPCLPGAPDRGGGLSALPARPARLRQSEEYYRAPAAGRVQGVRPSIAPARQERFVSL